METKPPLITLHNVRKSFDGRVVLEDVDFDVREGETLVIMGGSGCGKSTLLRMMIGSLKPDSGSIRMLGQEVTELDEEGMNKLRLQFGILFQSGALFNSMTIAENIALPLQEHTSLDSSTIEIMVKIKLEQVGLRQHAEKYPAQISGGMKKRAGLARALALDPRILFYDEPSAGLDPVTSAEIDRLIMDLSRKLGVTSIVVTHEMDSAFTIADRMVMLDKGRTLLIDDRARFQEIRDAQGELEQDMAVIRQFLLGSADGPISQRRDAADYEQDLLGLRPDKPVERPSLLPTRRKI